VLKEKTGRQEKRGESETKKKRKSPNFFILHFFFGKERTCAKKEKKYLFLCGEFYVKSKVEGMERG